MKYSIHNIENNGSDEKISAYVELLNERRESHEFKHDEDSINAPFDTRTISSVKELVEDMGALFAQYIFVIGIGGSNLGPKAVYDAVGGYNQYNDFIQKIVWIESVDEGILSSAKDIISELEKKEELVIVVASKSGGTTETLGNASVIIKHAESKWGDMSQQVVVITNQDSKLDLWADTYHAHVLHIHDSIGGRFSMFSPIGLFPLASAGIEIDSLVLGAQKAVEEMSGYAKESALSIYSAYLSGKTIHDMFVFGAELETLGKWYRQLMGESLGKERDIHNKTVNTGITPTVSVGSTDLHSVGQLYVGGPKDKMTTFVVRNDRSSFSIPDHSILNHLEYIKGKTTSDVTTAIVSGIQGVYDESNIPYISVDLSGEFLFELGYFMQASMVQMMLLGLLMEVNSFNQPSVESYKTITKKLLQK